MCIVKDRSLVFYITIITLGFFFIFIDITPKHPFSGHIAIYRNDPDIVAGVILLFFGGFGIGHRTKDNLTFPSKKIFKR